MVPRKLPLQLLAQLGPTRARARGKSLDSPTSVESEQKAKLGVVPKVLSFVWKSPSTAVTGCCWGTARLGGTVGLLPILDEVDSVRAVVDGVLSTGLVEHLLVVDDGSSDGTLDELAICRQQWPQLDVAIRRNQRGLGSALLFGFEEVVRRYPFDRLVVLDGDLSHDPAKISALLAVPSDLVIGSRYMAGGRIENWDRARRVISFAANTLARRFLRLPARDTTSGFRVYGRGLVETVLANAACGGYEFQVEAIWLAASHQFSVAEVPIAFVERRTGNSKLATPEEALKFVRFVVSKAFSSRRRRIAKDVPVRARRSS